MEITAAAPTTNQPEQDAPASVSPVTGQQPGPARLSVLERVKAGAKAARENRTFELPLPDTVGQGVGLLLTVPRDAEVTVAEDWSGEVDVERDLKFMARHVKAVIGLTDTGWKTIEDLTVQDLAVAYGTGLRSAAPTINDDAEALRELYMSGTPPQIEPQQVVTAARLYRLWAQDPTLGL